MTKIKDYFELNPSKNTNNYTDYINYIDTSSATKGILYDITYLDGNFPSRANRCVKYDDILYSSVRPNLRHYYHYKLNYKNVVASTGYILLRNKNKELYSSEFLYYFLGTDSVVKYLSNIAELSQSTFPSFSAKDLGKIELPAFDFIVQKKIADILSAFDNLIKNNNKRIKLLEQMAENLYKEWFERFRFPGYEDVEFIDGFPKEWKICRIDQLSEVKAGGDAPADSTKEITDECSIPIYSNGIENEGLYGYTSKAKINKPSISISARGTVGYTCLRRVSYTPIVRLICIIPHEEKLVNWLFYYFKRTIVIANGTSQQQITIPMMSREKVLLPKNDLIQKFYEYSTYYLDEIDSLKAQNSNLEKQRDMLLPRLMSGKLEV